MTDRDARAFYGRWAAHYDRLATAPGVRSWRRAAVDALDLSAGETVVEMGVGTGANLALLREAVGPSGRVVGVDLTREMLGRARDRIVAAGWSNVHLVRGDATRPPVASGADAVLATFVVGMLADPSTAVADWLDGLAPGGRLVLLNAARSRRWWAGPLDRVFAALVALTSPGTSAGDPVAVLEDRVEAATAALAAGAARTDRRELAGGFLRLRRGRLAE